MPAAFDIVQETGMFHARQSGLGSGSTSASTIGHESTHVAVAAASAWNCVVFSLFLGIATAVLLKPHYTATTVILPPQ